MTVVNCNARKRTRGGKNADMYTTAIFLEYMAALFSFWYRGIMGLIYEGRNSSQIAEYLSVSPNTAKKYTQNIYNKTVVNNRMTLAHLINQQKTGSETKVITWKNQKILKALPLDNSFYPGTSIIISS